MVHVFSTFTRHRSVYTTRIVVRRRFHLIMKPIECILNSTKCVFHLKCWFIQTLTLPLSRSRSYSSVLCSSLNMTMLFFFRVVGIVKHYYLVDSSCIDWLTDCLAAYSFGSEFFFLGFGSLLFIAVSHRWKVRQRASTDVRHRVTRLLHVFGLERFCLMKINLEDLHFTHTNHNFTAECVMCDL